MRLFSDAFRFAAALSPSLIADAVFRSDYFCAYFIVHIVYVVFNIRWTTYTNGLHWLRSLILGFLMSVSSRFAMSALLSVALPDFSGFDSVIIFGIVWSLFNIAPFDFVYAVCKNSILKYVIQVCDSFVMGESVVITCETAVCAIGDMPVQTAVVSCLSLCLPIAIDLLDRNYIGKRFEPMAYQERYIGRIVIFVLVLVLVTHYNVLSFAQMRVVMPLVFVVISILDIAVNGGEPFVTVSCMPILSRLITYYPSYQKQNE